MEPPALAAGPAAPVRAAPGASANLVLPLPKGTQPFTYHWSRAGASLDDRFTTSDDTGGVRLTVSAAQTGDSGLYTLQASNAAGSDTSKIRLEVAAEEAPIGEDPPTFLRRLQDLTVKVGSRTRFLVEIISSTECKVTWYRNERRLLEAERVALARDGNFWCADVAAVSVDDAGRWTCTAENAGGRASCSAHLNVLVPKAYKRPEFVEELRALLTEQGTVSLECKVVGVPTPVLRWFKDSREIKAGDVFALTANAEDPTSLGTYTCEAVNCMGRAYSSSKVHVVGRASREGSARPSSSGMTPEPPPIFTKELEDAHVKVCDHLTLGCHIVVPPWPRSVVWYNKEGKVEPGERYHALEDGVGGYLLEIPSAEWADEGEWKCVATSAGGRVGITTCFVTMDAPKNYRKPRFMENLQAVLTEEGLVSFECKVVGFPTPVLSWFKDGQELKPGDVYQLTGTNSLGSYCCIARNCMGQASSSAELTVEDIQNQLNEEEKLQLFSKNQAPKFLQGLKSVEAKIDEPFRFTVRVAIPPEPSVLWYRDDQPVDESTRCHLEKEDKGLFNLDIQNLEFLDQAEWKCVAMNDFGHSVTSCFLKLVIPRHYKKPRFLENLQAILSDEGAVNLECKVIGVPQPVLKWYKDGEELKPGDIHRIISGQDGTCCLGTYTCEAQNCMGIAASSASLLGFDDSVKNKTKAAEEPLQRNLSLSTIHEERTSQMYDTPVGDITLDDKGEISFSFDGKEVSVSLYETPDLTEEEALQIVEMYADQLSENVTEHNVVELPPLRFVKETSTSGNLLMEAIIIDVSPDYFAAPDEDLRTEADIEDLSIADENGLPQLSLDQDIEIGGEDYLEKTMALLSEEKSDFAAKSSRRKSDSQKSADDFFSLSRDQSLSEEKRDDDTHISESELQSFASARSSAKVKSKTSKPSGEEGQESSEPTKTILLKEEIVSKFLEKEHEVPAIKPKRERRSSRGSRRSSTSSEKSIGKSREELLRLKTDHEMVKPSMNDDEFKNTMDNISTSLSKVINDVQLIERDIILKSELMSSAATASRSLEIINSLITPLSEIHSIAEAAKESVSESREVTSTIFNSIPQPLKILQQSLTIIEKCIDMESDNKTLVKKTCVAFIETCGTDIQKVISDITSITSKNYIKCEAKVVNEIESVGSEMITVIKFSAETIRARNLLTEASEIKHEKPTQETKHLRETQKAVFELKSPLNSLLRIVKSAESGNIANLSKIKQSEVIMNDMSSSIQDLQTALEQIESLSIKESSITVHKYNTEIIETVMDSILRLRGSFEQLSTDLNTEEDKTVLQETLSYLKENLTEISSKIETIDKKVGQFDILQSENKLDVLQKMAQILIALENNLPRLETLPAVKSHMDTFHKNLTKVLENVIESNDAKKYIIMMEICDTVNIINASIKNVDTENVLPYASLSNTLKIIQNNLGENIFESELNCSIMNNISEVLVGIQEAINKAEEISLQSDSERIQDFSTLTMPEAKVNIILEHIEQTIAAIDSIKTMESTQELKLALTPTFENIRPILEELRRSVATIQSNEVEVNEHISDLLDVSFAQTIATPLCELNQNIIVLNQLIVENIDYIKDSTEVITAIAMPLQELHTTLEILQHDVISQYEDDLTPYEVSVNMASVVQNLQRCMVMIHEQTGIEGAEEMSTLEDISGIKTSAETLPSDRLVLPIAEETAIEQSILPLMQEIATTATAQTLQTLNEHIMVLQTPDVIEALDTLSEMSDYSSLKSVIVGLEDLQSGIEGILHPVPIESSIDLEDTTNILKLAAIAEPMQEIHLSLSVLDTNNIPVFENLLDLPAEKIHSVFQSISELKNSLEQCMGAVLPAMEISNNTIEISNKVSTLREVCKHLNEIFATSKDSPSDITLPKEVQNLETVVNSLIEATDVSKDIKIDHVKSITEELYMKVIAIQDDIVQFTAQSAETNSQEAKLIEIVSEVEKNIAVLEQYDFIDLSRASDITTYMSSQKAIEINSESLVQIQDIAENAVNVLQDFHQEIPIADLMMVEDFFKTCKNEFTILHCLISKATSHKKIIRLFQEFNSLQILINHFTTKRLELSLSDDINECLTNFLLHADECLRNARISLVKVVQSQSDMLIKTPLIRLESIRELNYEIESETNNAIASVVKTLQDAAETSKYLTSNLQNAIIEELSQPDHILGPYQEEKVLTEKMEHLTKVVDAQSEESNLDDSSNKVFKRLETCINNHHSYKDALGTGKTLIMLKCLAECASIIHEEVTEKKMTINETTEIKENSLKEVLAEMLQPLQALQSQLASIREEVLSGADEDSISIDISTTESIMQTMAELHKDIVQQIEMGNSALHNEDILLIAEVEEEINTIQDSIKSMENVEVAQTVKEITKPMSAIGKSLQTIISIEKDKETLSKETSDSLINHIDQYIELIEIVEEISAIITVDAVKESFEIARELKTKIMEYQNEIKAEMLNIVAEQQAKLAQKLQMAISTLQVQVLGNAQELDPTVSANALRKFVEVTAQLQVNLVSVTGVQVPVQTPISTKSLETVQELPVSTTITEFVGKDTTETINVEHPGTLDKEIPEKYVEVTTLTTENVTQVAQEVVVVTEEIKHEGSDNFDENIVPLQKKADTEPSETAVIDKCQVLVTIEAKTDSPTIKTDIVEIVTVPESTTATCSENLVNNQAPKTQQPSKEKTERTISTTHENLMQHITEYVSEDIIEVVNKVSSNMNVEELKHSINIAKELRNRFAATETSNKEDYIGGEIEAQHEQRENLAMDLNMALSILSEDTLKHLHELVPSVNKNAIKKLVVIIENLKTDLAVLSVSQQEVLQVTEQDPQDLITKLESTLHVKEDTYEPSEQATLLTESKPIPENNMQIRKVDMTSETLVSPETVESVDVLIEAKEVVEKVIKQGEQTIAEKHSISEIQQDIAELQADSFTQEEIQLTQPSESSDYDVKVLEQTSVSLDIGQQESSFVDPILTQEVTSFQTSQEITSIEASEIKDAMSLPEALKQVVTEKCADPGSTVAVEEKNIQVAVMDDLVEQNENLTDYHKTPDVYTTVATETTSDSQSIEPSAMDILPQVAQKTNASSEAEETLLQNINKFLSDVVLHTLSEMTINSDDFNKAVQIAKELQQYTITSNISTVEELKYKLPRDIEHTNLILLQQILPSLRLQILENDSETSPSLNYKLQHVENVIMQLTNDLSVALAVETIPKCTEDINVMLKYTDDNNDNNIKNQENKAKLSSEEKKQFEKSIEIPENHSNFETTDEFVDCSDKLGENNTKAGELSAEKKSLETKIAETVMIETTKAFEEFFDSPTLADSIPSSELIAVEVEELTILEEIKNAEEPSQNAELVNIRLNDSFASAITVETNVTEVTEAINDTRLIVKETALESEVETSLSDSQFNVEEIATLETENVKTFDKPIASLISGNQLSANNLEASESFSIATEKPEEAPSNTDSVLPEVKITTPEIVQITSKLVDVANLDSTKTASISVNDSFTSAIIDEQTEIMKIDLSGTTLTVGVGSKLDKPLDEETTLQGYAKKYDANVENKPAVSAQASIVQSQPVSMECSSLVQQINVFISDEVVELINEISSITNSETLKDSVAVAKELLECVVTTDSITAEETSPINQIFAKRAHLSQTLQEALSTWQIQSLDIEKAITPIISPTDIHKVSKIITHLQDCLSVANVIDEKEKIKVSELGAVEETKELNSMTQLETLLRDVNMKIKLTPEDGNIEEDSSESLKDTLDEVQTVIIKLKQEYDGANDTLNETLEDLECSVRSVQLQINEESPPQLLTEACETLQLLVENMNTTQQDQVSQVLPKPEKTENILEKCSKETNETVKLLDLASQLDSKKSTDLASIVTNLLSIKDSLKFLRVSFLSDADTVIENGVKIIECLNQVEENIFSLERDVDIAQNVIGDKRDSILTAIHSVYGGISNMRSAVSSVQKRFMFENYGKPSESLLHAIKNIAFVSSSDNENNKHCWKKLSKSLRKVLNHFEDVKFYINLDKTARLPSDAAFTKIILEELRDNIANVLVPQAMLVNCDMIQKVDELLKCVEVNFISIESVSSLQVKNKIPMFKDIATEMLNTTNLLKMHFKNSKDKNDKIIEESKPLDVIINLKDQDLPETALAIEEQQAEIPEIKQIKEKIFTTTNLDTDETFDIMPVTYSSAVEVSHPSEQQALLIEDNTESFLSEIINEVSLETKSLSTSLEQNEQSEIIKAELSLQPIEIGQISISEDDLETKSTHDSTLTATTSKQDNNKLADTVIEVESQIEIISTPNIMPECSTSEIQVEKELDNTSSELKQKNDKDSSLTQLRYQDSTEKNSENVTTSIENKQKEDQSVIISEKQDVELKQTDNNIIEAETKNEQEREDQTDLYKKLQREQQVTCLQNKNRDTEQQKNEERKETSVTEKELIDKQQQEQLDAAKANPNAELKLKEACVLEINKNIDIVQETHIAEITAEEAEVEETIIKQEIDVANIKQVQNNEAFAIDEEERTIGEEGRTRTLKKEANDEEGAEQKECAITRTESTDIIETEKVKQEADFMLEKTEKKDIADTDLKETSKENRALGEKVMDDNRQEQSHKTLAKKETEIEKKEEIDKPKQSKEFEPIRNIASDLEERAENDFRSQEEEAHNIQKKSKMALSEENACVKQNIVAEIKQRDDDDETCIILEQNDAFKTKQDVELKEKGDGILLKEKDDTDISINDEKEAKTEKEKHMTEVSDKSMHETEVKQIKESFYDKQEKDGTQSKQEQEDTLHFVKELEAASTSDAELKEEANIENQKIAKSKPNTDKDCQKNEEYKLNQKEVVAYLEQTNDKFEIDHEQNVNLKQNKARTLNETDKEIAAHSLDINKIEDQHVDLQKEGTEKVEIFQDITDNAIQTTEVKHEEKPHIQQGHNDAKIKQVDNAKANVTDETNAKIKNNVELKPKEEVCALEIEVDHKTQEERKSRDKKEESNKLQREIDLKHVKENARVMEEMDDKARGLKIEGDSSTAKQNVELKRKEDEDRAFKEETDANRNQKTKQEPCAQKEITKEVKKVQDEANIVKEETKLKEMDVCLKQEKDDTEIKETHTYKASVMEEELVFKTKQDMELKYIEEKALKDLRKVETVTQDAKLKQIEDISFNLNKDDALLAQEKKREQKEVVVEEDTKAKASSCAELKQKEKAFAIEERVEADLKTKEKQEARDTNEKVKKVIDYKLKQETDFKQTEERVSVTKETNDKESTIKEQQDVSKAEKGAYIEKEREEKNRSFEENTDADLKKISKLEARSEIENADKVKHLLEKSHKVIDETMLKEKESCLKQENDDPKIKQKQVDKAHVMEINEPKIERKDQRDSNQAEILMQEANIKQIVDDTDVNQKTDDEISKLKQTDISHASKEEEANRKEKNDAELKQMKEAFHLKEKAEVDLKNQKEEASIKKKQDKKTKKVNEDASKLKQETDLKQTEENTRTKIESEDKAREKKEKDELKAKQEEELKQNEDEDHALKKETNAVLKKNIDQKACVQKEKAEEIKKIQDEAKNETELKEREAILRQEKDEQREREIKQHQADKDHVIEKNELKLKLIEEQVQQESSKSEKVTEDNFKLIEKDVSFNQGKDYIVLEETQEVSANEEEYVTESKGKNTAELKEKTNLKTQEEQQARDKKEKAKKTKKVKEDVDKIKQETDPRQTEEKSFVKKETDGKARAIKEEQEASKLKQDYELKQKEEARTLKEEKIEQEALVKQEEEEIKKLQGKADKSKEENELKDKEVRLKQEEDDKALIIEEEVASKAKHDLELIEKTRALKGKAPHVSNEAEKVKQEAKLKQEVDAHVNQDKDNDVLKPKKKEKACATDEEKEGRAKANNDVELKQEACVVIENAATDLKTKEQLKEHEVEAKTKIAAELQLKEAGALKEKTADLKEEQEEGNKKENSEMAKRVKDVADKIKQETDLKQTDQRVRLIKETDEAKLKEQQQDLELKQKEIRALKEKSDSDIKQNNENKTCLQDEKESKEQQMTEERLLKKQKTKMVTKVENIEIAKKNQHNLEKEECLVKKTEGVLQQKLETTSLVENINEGEDNALRKNGKKKINKTKINDEDTPGKGNEELIKQIYVDEVSKKTSKYTERLDQSERRDDELHVYKEDSQRQAKKENGDVNYNSKCEFSHESRYIKEYQYEPSQTGQKIEAREKPSFVDHNHRDYTMEFARPSGYRERSFDVEKPDNLNLRDHLGKNAAIYRAQTLVLDSQLRSSSSLYLDPTSCRTSEQDRRSEIRHRSKAHSEARTINSDTRTGLSRDSRRKPVFSTYLTDRTAVEGSRVKLTCSVLSSSDPTVTWYKNGVLLDNKLKYRTKLMDGLITLEVLNAVPSDSAEYSCTIQNENGSVSSSANLKVYPSFEASPIPPTFTRSIRDFYHMAENELVLECRIRGQPLPTITWLKDDKSISTVNRYQAYYLADGVCRLAIEHPTPEDSGKYTCKAENSVWSDQITHVVSFTGKESCLGPNIATLEKSRFNRQSQESRRPHFTNVLSDYKVVTGGTIGLQVEIRGAPTRVEWLREGCSVTEVYKNAKTFVEHGLYTLALSDVTEKESGMYTCRAWSSQCHVDMNAAITVVQPNELDGKPAIIVGRPEKDILISVGEDVNISFRVQGEPKPKVIFMKGIRDITTSQRVCKMTSDDYVKFTLKRSVVSDAGTYCILARNAYGCDRAFVTVVVRQRATSDNLISDWTYPADDSTLSLDDRRFKSVPVRIPGEPCVVEGGNNWISLGWPKSEPGTSAPVLAYKVESWLLGKDGGARWVELGITPLNSYDIFNLKQGEEYHFRVTPRNRYGWGESVQTSSPTRVGLAGDRPEFSESLPGQLKVLVGETANLSCSVKGTPVPELVWMKNGHEIEDDDKRLSSSFNGINCSLIIKDINIEDEARYSCEATNIHGRASTYARLAVVTDRSIWEADAKLKRERSADVEGDYPPQFTMRLRDRRVQVTYPVRLTCQVIGSPDPRITWFKDGGEVAPDNRRSHSQDEHFHTLEIAPTTLEDGGVYEAMARNNSGAVSCRCNLVVDKGIRAYVAPEFCCGLEPLYRLTDGEELRISAVVEAYPSVGVTWYRDGVRLRPSRRAIMTLDRDGQIELALAAVTSRDAGVYSCTASNEVGRASTSGKVEVIGTNVSRTPAVFISPDEPYSKEPMFIRKPRSSEAREGDTVIIACEVVGDPKPEVYWLRDFLKPDYYRDSSHFKRMGDGPEYRFEIPHAKLDYTGAYSVIARNLHGEAKAVISLQILAKDPTTCDDAHNIRYGRVEVLPRFSKELTDLLSCDGDAVEFECLLSGHPEPNVRWFHYHELIRDCSDFETSFEEGTARLKIKQVTADDEGTYTCEAANNLGKATSSACLVVYPPGEPNTLSQRLRRPPAFLSAASTPRSTPRSTPARSVSRTPGPETRRLCSPARTLGPSFYTYPFNKVAEEGDSVSLQCAIKGNPAPWATWDKDGVIITPSSRITIKEKDDVLRVLEIDQVTIDDVGVYRITIENEFGRQEASARIEVITQKGKFYAGVRAVSPSPRKSLTYRGRRPSTPRQD